MAKTPSPKKLSVSFFSKNETKCPVCNNQFRIESVRSGRGRFNAKGLSLELRRLYNPTKKYGLVYPLIYYVIVCPKCWYSSFPSDFDGKDYDLEALKKTDTRRKKYLKLIFNYDFNFSEVRTLESGIASYFLAIFCYNHHKDLSFRKCQTTLSALRSAWCLDDYAQLEEEKRLINVSTDYINKMALSYRKLALESLEQHIEALFNNKKKQIEVTYYGPDLDHDYGYNGIFYLNCYLGFIFIDYKRTEKEQYEQLIKYRNNLARVFGMGKVDKSAPSPLKNSARRGYELIREKIKEIEALNPNFAKT